MNPKIKIYLIIGVVASIMVVLALSFYFLSYNSRVNYLIPGVSYYGYYNHFFNADSTIVTSVASILGYWQDGRFSLADLVKHFHGSKDLTSYVTTAEIADFFKSNGYEVYRWTSDKPGDEISQIKKYVNQNQKIPVIVYQKRSFLPDNQEKGFRVVIGISDSKNQVTVHDFVFGNNFLISYEDFNKLFLPNARAILAVWPGVDLTKNLKMPDYNTIYPERLAVMDKLGEYLIRGSEVVTEFNRGSNKKALQLQRQFIDDNNFNYLPTIQKIYFYTVLAKLFLVTNQPDKVIEITNSKVLPFNHDLDKPDNEWTEQVTFFQSHGYAETKLVEPYFLLGLAYLAKGDKESARKNFKEALKIYPDYKLVQETLKQLK